MRYLAKTVGSKCSLSMEDAALCVRGLSTSKEQSVKVDTL
jgi:hypothetical protein